MKGPVFTQCSALRALRDGSALLSNVEQRSIIVRTVCGAVAANTMVTTTGLDSAETRGKGGTKQTCAPPW